DSIVLAHRFCVPTTLTYPAAIEQLLPISTGSSGARAPIAPYRSSDVSRWFGDNFAYRFDGATGGPSPLPILAMLTAHNPVSNFCPSKFNHRGQWQSGVRYAFADSVRHNNRIYV